MIWPFNLLDAGFGLRPLRLDNPCFRNAIRAPFEIGVFSIGSSRRSGKILAHDAGARQNFAVAAYFECRRLRINVSTPKPPIARPAVRFIQSIALSLNRSRKWLVIVT